MSLQALASKPRVEAAQHRGPPRAGQHRGVRRRGAGYLRRLERRAAQRAAGAERAQNREVSTEPDLAEEAAVDVVRVEEVPACAEQATAAVHKEEFLVIGTAVEPFPAVESTTAAKAGVDETEEVDTTVSFERAKEMLRKRARADTVDEEVTPDDEYDVADDDVGAADAPNDFIDENAETDELVCEDCGYQVQWDTLEDHQFCDVQWQCGLCNHPIRTTREARRHRDCYHS